MSTPVDLATQVYLGPGGLTSAVLSGGKLVPEVPLTPAVTIILAVPHLGRGGHGFIHVTGTFDAPSFALYTALSPDLDGWDGSTFYLLRDFIPTTPGGPYPTQTFDFPFGTGVEDYDAGVAAGERYVALTPAAWTEITAISYDYTQPGGLPPLRQWPRSDGLGMSSAPRLYPPPRSIQASNRRVGGYL